MNFVPPELERILLQTAELSRACLVGGAVRDALLGLPTGRDFDIEVFGVNYEQLVQALSRWGRTDLVGRSFGVVKLNTGGDCQYDFTVPRQDSKVAPGHKGFEVDFDPAITPEAGCGPPRFHHQRHHVRSARRGRRWIFLAARRICGIVSCGTPAPPLPRTRCASCAACNLREI